MPRAFTQAGIRAIVRAAMRVRVASDLHFEFHADGGAALAGELALGEPDVLVVAGDLSSCAGLRAALHTLCHAAAPRPVVYVLGNHEAYGGTWERACEEAQSAQVALPNLTVLEQSIGVVHGRRFVGCTLWFPHSGQVEPLDRGMADFKAIAGIRAWLPSTARSSASFLAATVRPGDVVVTHHLPHPRSIAPRYQGAPLNPYFLHDVAATVEHAGAALWVHGHTHVSCDYVVGRTRVLCNPFGYARGVPGEPNRAFRADLDVIV